MPHSIPTIEALGDHAVLIRLGDRIDPALNARVHALAAHLRGLPEAVEVIPAFASVAVSVRTPDLLDQDFMQRIRALVDLSASAHAGSSVSCSHELTVDFAAGEDLHTAAQALQLSPQALIERLCAARYQVAMLGFLPGFPYLLGLDPALALPRRSSPRERVPANTLALGGAQLGIYPCSSPGGWHLLGRVDAVLFDPTREQPALLAPGDHLRLRPA